jgi:hypothetical protein
LIDPYYYAMRSDEVRDLERDMAQTRAEIQQRIPETIPPVPSSKRVAGANMTAWASRRAISASSLPSEYDGWTVTTSPMAAPAWTATHGRSYRGR